jgi:nucleoside phosphorylase
MEEALAYRLTVRLAHAPLTPIPWPAGLAPKVVSNRSSPNRSMPKADVLLVTWTAAEAEALADVLTPGHTHDGWTRYAKDWTSFEPQLTHRSPAAGAKCMAHYAVIEIGQKRVVVAKSELHLATDAKSLPLRQPWRQMIGDVGPAVVISTGTAGGIGTDIDLGDVLATSSVQFDCTGEFRDEPFASAHYSCDFVPDAARLQFAFEQLVPVNAGQLQPTATRAPALVTTGDVLTADGFAIADPEDHWGLHKADPQARMVEMDDAVLGLVCTEDLHSMVPWFLARNASDPQAPQLATPADEKREANLVYTKYGYWTTVGSAITCWAIVAGL